MCADLLAKADCIQHLDFISYVTPLAHVLETLKFDVSETLCTRLVSC